MDGHLAASTGSSAHRPVRRYSAVHHRFEALDSWRGICACLVAVFHFHAYGFLYTSPFLRNFYLFVDFFFVLSGFVIAWNYADKLTSVQALKGFMILRAGRLYPLHLVTLAALLLVQSGAALHAHV